MIQLIFLSISSSEGTISTHDSTVDSLPLQQMGTSELFDDTSHVMTMHESSMEDPSNHVRKCDVDDSSVVSMEDLPNSEGVSCVKDNNYAEKPESVPEMSNGDVHTDHDDESNSQQDSSDENADKESFSKLSQKASAVSTSVENKRTSTDFSIDEYRNPKTGSNEFSSDCSDPHEDVCRTDMSSNILKLTSSDSDHNVDEDKFQTSNESISKDKNINIQDENRIKIKIEPDNDVDSEDGPIFFANKYQHDSQNSLKDERDLGYPHYADVAGSSALFTASFVNMNTCQLCGRVFSRAEHLQRHIWIVHGVDRYGRIYDPVVEELERKQALYEKRLEAEKFRQDEHKNGTGNIRLVKEKSSNGLSSSSYEKEPNISSENQEGELKYLSSIYATKICLPGNQETNDSLNDKSNVSSNGEDAGVTSIKDQTSDVEKLHENHVKSVPFPFRLATQCHICGRIYSKGAHLRNHLHVAHGLSGDDALPDPIQEELLRKQALFECHQKSSADEQISSKSQQLSSSDINLQNPYFTNTLDDKRIKSPLSDTVDNFMDDEKYVQTSYSRSLTFSSNHKDCKNMKKVNHAELHKSATESFLYSPECRFCGRHFFRMSLLEKHMWRVHGVDRFGNVDDPIIAELARKQALFEESYDEYINNLENSLTEKENKIPDMKDGQLINISSSNDNVIFVKTERSSSSPDCQRRNDWINQSTNSQNVVSGANENSDNSYINGEEEELNSDVDICGNTKNSHSSSLQSDSKKNNPMNDYRRTSSDIDIDRARNKAVQELVAFAVQDSKETDMFAANDGDSSEGTMDYDQFKRQHSDEQFTDQFNEINGLEDIEPVSANEDKYISEMFSLIQKQNVGQALLMPSKSACCSCPFCDKVCSRPVQLQRHIFRIHGVDRYGNIDDPIAAELMRKQNMFEKKNDHTMNIEQTDLDYTMNSSHRYIKTPPFLKDLAGASDIDYSLATFGDVEVLTMKSQVVCSDSLGWKATGSLIKETKSGDEVPSHQKISDSEDRTNRINNIENADSLPSLVKSSSKKRSNCLDRIAERLQKRAKLLSSQDNDVLLSGTDNQNLGQTDSGKQSESEDSDNCLNENSKNDTSESNENKSSGTNLVSEACFVSRIKSEPLSPSPDVDVNENISDIPTTQTDVFTQDQSLPENADYFRNIDNFVSGFDGSFRCHICGKCVARKPNLQKHLQRIHGLDKHGREIDPIAEELARKQALFEHKPLYETVSSILDHEDRMILPHPYVGLPNTDLNTLGSDDHVVGGNLEYDTHVRINCHDSMTIKMEPKSPLVEVGEC